MSPRLVLTAAAALASFGAVAGPSNHSFAWTHEVGSAVLLVNGSSALTATNRGWVDDAGNNNFGDASSNYIVGVCGSSDACAGADNEHHNYFAFSTGQLGTVTSATLKLYQPGASDTSGGTTGFLSNSSSLTYTLWDALLNPTTDAGLGLYADLGSGTSFGSVVVDATSNGTTVSITFNAAGIAALQAAADGNGAFYVGGAVGAVPEPQTYALMLAGLGAVGFMARRRRV